MYRLGQVDITSAQLVLDQAYWEPAGDPGTYAMISRPQIERLPVDDIVRDVMSRHFAGLTVGRMLALSRLVPGQVIEPHLDRHDNHCKTRVHVPLLTNPSVVFTSEKLAMHMQRGVAYVIDPTKVHSVANGGSTDRIHLFWNVIELQG